MQKGPSGISRQQSRAGDRTLWLARPSVYIPISLTKKTTEFKHVDLVNENARCKRLQAGKVMEGAAGDGDGDQAVTPRTGSGG